MRVALVSGGREGDRLGAALAEGLATLAVDVETLRERPARGRFGRWGTRALAEEVRAARPHVVVTLEAPRLARALAPRLGTRAPLLVEWIASADTQASSGVHRLLGWGQSGPGGTVTGHPAVSEPVAAEEEVAAARRTFGLGAAPAILAVPPAGPDGARILPLWRRALEKVSAQRPGLRVVVADAEPRGAFEGWPGRPVLLAPRRDALAAATRRALVRACGVALVADGAETLWLAPQGTPSVVARDPHRWTARGEPAPLDAVAATRVVPVLAGLGCRPTAIAAALNGVLDRPEAQRGAMAAALPRLGAGGEAPGLRAARAVLALVQEAEAIQPPPRTRVPSGA